MTPRYEFSLQVFEMDCDGGLDLRPEVRRAIAASPEEAAAKLIGEQLLPAGSPRAVRAKVWRVAPSGVLTTMLYRDGHFR